MARLISRTQVEEQQDFIRNTSFSQNVIISGSLLVSESFSLGTNPDTKQEITGSVEITGSLTLDGPFNVVGDQALDLTASVSLDSLDTRLFGGIRPEDFGAMDATLYVSSTSGNDNNDGRTPQFPLRTVKKAAEIASAGDDGRFGLDSGSLFTGFRIEVSAGTYLEDNPIELPKNTTVWGAGLRVCKILAKNENEDLFWVNSGNYLAEMTFGGLRVFPSVDNSKSGFAVAFAPNAFITTSPYVQNCSMISNQENSFLELYEDIPAGGGGLNVDGNVIHPDSPLASMVLDAYTQVAPNGVGCQVVGRGFIQLVSFFTNFSAYAVKVLDGGQAVLLNSNTSFGDFGMYASGSRFITGSGGNGDAFASVRDNYTIIIDTIEDGLSAIPELVPNTDRGIKTTSELQKFISGKASNDTAEKVKADYQLVSSIVDNGILNMPGLLSKASTRGYSTGSVWNISKNEQITGSVTASTSELTLLADRFEKVQETLEVGPRITGSYTLVDNIEGLVQVTTQSATPVGFASSQTTINDVVLNFNNVKTIVKNGTSATPFFTSSNEGNIKVTDTEQFITDISSSAVVQNKISSSFSIVHDILLRGTGSAPTIIQSSSFENSSIDYQNGYAALLGNLSFIQEETIAYLSSSWSTFDYNEVTCKRDLGYIVSGAAHDLIYGGNEESVRNGNFYYLYPSEATSSQKQQTLDAIRYASGLATRVVGDITFQEPSTQQINGYEGIIDNKTFIQEEVIAYISSSWRGFEYDEVKCKRDVGYILDAVATDLRYGGNERSIIAGKFYYDYPSEATTTQLLQTIDGIEWARDLTTKILEAETFTTASDEVQGTYDLIVNNRNLIQEETVNFIDTQYPNLDYLRNKCKRDTGYILDAVATDLLYGGNQKSIRAGLYYREVPSKVNGDQLEETLAGIIYTKNFVDSVVTNTIIESPRLIRNTEARVQAGNIDFVTSSISGTESERAKVSASIGIVEDIIKQGEDSILAAIAGNTPNISWTTEDPILVTGISAVSSSTQLSASLSSSVTSSFDVVVKVIESGSTITSDLTIGSASNSELPVAQRGIPKDSYPPENLDSTVIGTTIPAEVTLVSNMEDGIRFNSGNQYTSSISASNITSTNISESFSTVIDIIEYGITSSLVLSGSDGSSTYFEVVTLPNDSTAFYINQNQLQYFDGRESWGTLNDAEDTGSFLGSKKDPTLTLLRNEMYNFSINDLGTEDSTINEPFLIKTKRSAGYDDVFAGDNIINNGITFGTLTFTPLYNTPDTLYYVNPNNVSASGVINIVDSLPLSAEQEYVEVPSRGQFEKTLNTSENIKVTNGTQYTQSLDASITNRNNISGSIDTVINILSSGSLIAPTIVKNIDGLIKRSSVNQVTSSFDISSTIVNKISSSVGIVLNIIENGTGSLPTQVDNTEEYIAVGTTSQFTTSSISASFDDIQFISESFEIVARILENGSGSYETASLYVSEVTASNTVAAYNLIKQNIDFIQEETIAYLSSSWSTFDYDEDKCKRDVGLITSGAAEDLINNVYSASIVNGKFYLEYPSEATGSQLNQTLDGIRYASRLAQNIASNITFGSPSQERLDTETIIRDNKEFIQEEAITFLSSSWSAFDYNDVTCKRDIGYILDATITDIVYGGNERSINAGVFYYKYPSEATGSQLFPTVDGIQYAGEVTQKVVTGSIFSEPSSTKVRAYNLVHENRELIQDEVIQYISSSWNSFDYDDVKCRRDTGYILDAATTDLIYGGNERSVIAGDFYYRYPSQATGSQLNQTVDGIVYAQRLADKMLTNTLLVTASLERREVYDLIERNREMVQAEVISYISSSWSEFEYDDVKCSRDVGHILDAVATDLRYGGNERSVIAGEYYWRYPSEATNVQKIQTIDGIVHAARIVQKLIQNEVLETPSTDNLAIWNLIRNNRTLIQNEVTEFIDFKYPFFTYNRVKCRRDVGYILDAILTDLIWGGNERSIIAGDFYYRYPSEATTIQLDETVDGIRYAESLVQKIIAGEEFYQPSLVLNTDGNIKVTELEPTASSIALSGSYQTEISSSVNLITEIISGGLSYLPEITESVDGLIKINNITQFTSANSGSEVESGYVTRSVGFINDIIRLGTDDIPFALAKWYDDTLDNPQNLTTGSYVTASGTYTTDTEFGIVSSSFGSIINVIENGTDYLPTLEYNTANNIKVTATEQFISPISGSITTINKVSASVGIVEDIVQNGVGSLPTITFNNSDKDNLVKVTSTSQFTTGSFGGELQRRLISSSIAVVTTILENGTGSLPTLVDYDTPSDSPKTLAAYNILKENIDFIQAETIAYLSSSWSTFDYNDVSCSRDVGLIISGAAEDMLHNANSASIVNGKFYFEYPSEATSSQLNQTLDGIRYAGRMAENIVKGYTYQTSSVEISGSVELIRNNKEFIQEETIEFISSSWDNFDYNSVTCKRDVGYILDAVATDLLYGGNERSVVAGRFYYDYPSSAIVGGVPSATQQKDPTVTAIDYVQGLVTEIVGGATFQTASNEVEYVYEAIRENREFIQNETIAFVNAKYPNLDYNEASCSRDTGFIVDAVATDLRWGGNQRSREAGRFYYLFPSKATGVQVEETTDALVYTKDLIEKIVDKETLFVPTGSLNTDNSIKVTSFSPAPFLDLSDPNAMIEEISASFAIVSDAILNGTGSTPTASLYGSPLLEDNVVRSHAMITASVPFIQNEVVEYISSSWVGFDYDDAKCRRDVGFIVNGVAEDLLHGVVSASVVNAKYYYEFPSEATSSQAQQTVDGINYAYQLTEQILRGTTFTSPSTQISASVELIRNNREFIQSESIAYLSSSWEGFDYEEATCRRDVGHIVDAVATDLLYGGNQRSKIAGEFYYLYPSTATTTQLEPTTTGIKYAGDVVSKIVEGGVFVTASDERLAGNRVILDNKEFISSEVIQYVSSSWSDFDYNDVKCKRDVGYILNAVATDLLYGGNERSREAGRFYYEYPSEATTIQLNQTIDGINYASSLARKVMENETFVTASTEVSASVALLRTNREFIQNETIEFISSSWSNVVYNEDKCRRDTGYIVDAATTDLLYGGNERSVTAGLFYWRYPSRATKGGTPSEANQLDPTVDGIRFANGTAENVVQNLEYSTPTNDTLNGVTLLRNNTTFIQKETIAYLSSSWSEFDYNEVSCSRDLGYIIDAVATDLKYGGNERAVQAGTFYYYIPSIATTEQKPQTTDGIDFAKGLAEKIVRQKQLVFAPFLNRESATALRDAKKTLQGKAISYTNAAFPNFEYNEEKCYRDTGFILDAIATDLIYGGNERSIRAAESYYNGVYGSAAVVINEQKKETAETNRYLRTQFQFVARKAPVEEFGSLIITTGHDFSYAGSGVTYKALPPNQGGDGIPDPSKEIIEIGGGRVFFTSGNELGDFRIGAGLVINQATGTLQGRTFSRSLFSLVTPFSLALQD